MLCGSALFLGTDRNGRLQIVYTVTRHCLQRNPRLCFFFSVHTFSNRSRGAVCWSCVVRFCSPVYTARETYHSHVPVKFSKSTATGHVPGEHATGAGVRGHERLEVLILHLPLFRRLSKRDGLVHPSEAGFGRAVRAGRLADTRG